MYLHYTTSHYFTLHFITLHYSTLHYVMYIYIYMRTYLNYMNVYIHVYPIYLSLSLSTYIYIYMLIYNKKKVVYMLITWSKKSSLVPSRSIHCVCVCRINEINPSEVHDWLCPELCAKRTDVTHQFMAVSSNNCGLKAHPIWCFPASRLPLKFRAS